MSKTTNTSKMLALRIITGTYKNVTLYVSENSRPVTDRVKRTIFDILGGYVVDTRVADIFSGTGNLGIEALSRGCKFVNFVDNNPESIRAIDNNIQKIRLESNNFQITKLDYEKFLRKYKGELFDLVFADPPFSAFDDFKIHLFLKIMKQGAILVLKSPLSLTETFHPKSLELVEHKKIGINYVYFFRKVQPSP